MVFLPLIARAAAVSLPFLLGLALAYGRGWWAITLLAAAALVFAQWPRVRLLAPAAAAAKWATEKWREEWSRDRWIPWVATILALLIFGGVQWAGGAYTAEFDGYPDEAAHFMTALMIRDYLAQWPSGSPVTWAEHYYVHYPKVAFGHWPPLFHTAEAVWWLFVPPSRTTGMLLIGGIGLAVAVYFYRLARSLVPRPAALLAACLLVAAPVFQVALAQFMADLATLIFEMILLGALARLVRDGTDSALWIAGLACFGCLFVKGTGACLMAAPFLALLLSGRWRALVRKEVLLPTAAVAASAAIWFRLIDGSLARTAGWAGLNLQLADHFRMGERMVTALAGYGFPVLAVGGMMTLVVKREPVTVAAAAVTLSVAGTGLFLGAMNEPRQWLLAWPPMLLLSLAAIERLRCLGKRWSGKRLSERRGSGNRGVGRAAAGVAAGMAAVIAAGGALALFPWMRYQQQPVGYRELARFIQQPARMLISGAGGPEEGSWIVLSSLREKRPASVIVRATQTLSHMDWNGDRYRQLARTPAEVCATLDRLGITTVVLDEHFAARGVLPHEVLLRQTMERSAAWKLCGSVGRLTVYCRKEPLTGPHDPLRIDLRGKNRPGDFGRMR